MPRHRHAKPVTVAARLRREPVRVLPAQLLLLGLALVLLLGLGAGL